MPSSGFIPLGGERRGTNCNFNSIYLYSPTSSMDFTILNEPQPRGYFYILPKRKEQVMNSHLITQPYLRKGPRTAPHSGMRVISPGRGLSRII